LWHKPWPLSCPWQAQGRGRSGAETALTTRLGHVACNRNYKPMGLLVMIVVLGVTGCGYQLSGQAGTIPRSLQRVAVPMFSNSTTIPGLEHLVTAAVRTQLQRDGRARLGTETGATAQLRGEVRNYQLQLLANNRDDFALEYRVAVDVHVRVEDLQRGQTILNQTLAVTGEYVVSEQIVPTDIARDRAIQALARDAGERVVSLLLDRF
jgi:outer membrane lipopolysaccharide assembly protein LptE/RlpB